MSETRHLGTLFRFAPGDRAKMPDGRTWTVAAIARLSGEHYTFLVRDSEVAMYPTVSLIAQAKRIEPKKRP